MAEPVEVEILGQVFSVTSEDGEEHVREVAHYVDTKIREFAGSTSMSSFTAAVLTALNIASECQKVRRTNSEMEEFINRLASRLQSGCEQSRGVET